MKICFLLFIVFASSFSSLLINIIKITIRATFLVTRMVVLFFHFGMNHLHAFLLALAFCLLPSVSIGQELTDTLKVESGLSIKEIEELTTPMPSPSLKVDELAPSNLSSDLRHDLPLHPDLVPQPLTMHWYGFPILQRGDYLPRWSTGRIIGTSGMVGDKFSGYTAYSQMGFRQSLGEYWTLDASLSLQKTMYYNTASLNTSLRWHPSPYFEFTTFASYMPGTFMSQVQAVPTFQWGGYATFKTDTDVPFGVDLGASDYYDPFSGHHVVPIVQPFIKIGESKLGIDLGPLIYDAINKHGHGGVDVGPINPIPRPIKAIPQVRPR